MDIHQANMIALLHFALERKKEDEAKISPTFKSCERSAWEAMLEHVKRGGDFCIRRAK